MEGSSEMGGSVRHLPPPSSSPNVGVEVDVSPLFDISAAASPSGVAAGPQGSTGGGDQFFPSLAGVTVSVASDGAVIPARLHVANFKPSVHSAQRAGKGVHISCVTSPLHLRRSRSQAWE